jgi:hypothetical protein
MKACFGYVGFFGLFTCSRRQYDNSMEESNNDLWPGVCKSKEAFLKDLPALLRNPKYDRWCVAYSGDERIGIAPSEKDLIRECHKRGLKTGQYFIWVIAPHSSEVEEIDPSLYEFEPID